MESLRIAKATHRRSKQNKPTPPNTATISETTQDSSAIPLPSLPHELIFAEILTRLPVKSLLKFKYVAKSWLSLMSSPQFVKAHLNATASSIDRQRFLILRFGLSGYYFTNCSLNSLLHDDNDATATNSDVITLNIPNLGGPLMSRIFIVGCLNGLLCINTIENGLILWNPSTGKLKNVPDLIWNKRRKDESYYVAFGFGYDEINDDYKVVGINGRRKCYDPPSGLAEVMVYSIKTECWRRIGDFQGGHPLWRDYGIFANGKLHWLYWEKGCQSICSLDLATETYGQVDIPNFDEYSKPILDVFQGSLCMLSEKKYECTDVWVLQEYGVRESWIKLLSISVYRSMMPMLRKLFCMSEDGKVLVSCVGSLGLYDPKNDSFWNHDMSFLGGCVYVESLISPAVNNGVMEGQQKEQQVRRN